MVLKMELNRQILTIGGFVMTLYRTVSPAEATGKVKEVYDDIMATKDIDFYTQFLAGPVQQSRSKSSCAHLRHMSACHQVLGTASTRWTAVVSE